MFCPISCFEIFSISPELDIVHFKYSYSVNIMSLKTKKVLSKEYYSAIPNNVSAGFHLTMSYDNRVIHAVLENTDSVCLTAPQTNFCFWVILGTLCAPNRLFLIHVAAMQSLSDSKLINISQFSLPASQHDHWYWSVDSYAELLPMQHE